MLNNANGQKKDQKLKCNQNTAKAEKIVTKYINRE